ncbi:FixH family protein [Mesorhizobium sp. M0166]|uniref:FixH family protein n=1 Tax=Mesorhizobium sp. M0166 TaxID=2956902 RepID=UPI00333BE1A5
MQLDGFVVKNSYDTSQEFNRKADEGRAQAALGWSGSLQSQMARSANAAGPERQDSQAGGVKRTMMTSLAVANAAMMPTASSLGPNAY